MSCLALEYRCVAGVKYVVTRVESALREISRATRVQSFVISRCGGASPSEQGASKYRAPGIEETFTTILPRNLRCRDLPVYRVHRARRALSTRIISPRCVKLGSKRVSIARCSKTEALLGSVDSHRILRGSNESLRSGSPTPPLMGLAGSGADKVHGPSARHANVSEEIDI